MGRQIGPKGGEGCYRCLKRLNGHHLSQGGGGEGFVGPMAVIHPNPYGSLSMPVSNK